MGGMDDIRPYCQFGEINVYADPIARQGMLQMLPYCFAEHRYPGVPAIQLHEIHKHEAFRIGDLDIVPFEVMHHDLPILGYRIGPLAYITDHSHQTLDDAVAFARRIGARQTWLIHSSHDIGRHAEVNASLPSDIQMAYDGQVIEI